MSTNRTGTMGPIYLPLGSNPKTLRDQQGYFLIQIHSAQAAYFGPVWQKAKGLVVTSDVNLNHPALNKPIKSIQRVRPIARNEARDLGLNQNLVRLVPSVMTEVSVSVDFLVDRENQLVKLTDMINNNDFVASLSLAPGAALVAGTLSKLAQQLVQQFIPAQDQKSILQFSKDFNLATDGMAEGYYVFVGSMDASHPLPSPYEQLTVRDRTLLQGDRAVTELSYLILDVRCVQARTRERNEGAAWEAKLREAEDKARDVARMSPATKEQKDQAWQDCLLLLREAQALFRIDMNYLASEANAIVDAAFVHCRELAGPTTVRGDSGAREVWEPNRNLAHNILGVSDDDTINAALDQYADQVVAARRTLAAVDA